jgi:S1-C subfamily serine protease
VVVTSSDPFSDAYDKGLREGSVILEVNRKRVRSLNEFRRELRSLDPGDLVNFYVQTGEFKTFVTLRFGEAAG